LQPLPSQFAPNFAREIVAMRSPFSVGEERWYCLYMHNKLSRNYAHFSSEYNTNSATNKLLINYKNNVASQPHTHLYSSKFCKTTSGRPSQSLATRAWGEGFATSRELKPEPWTLNSNPKTLNPQLKTLNPLTYFASAPPTSCLHPCGNNQFRCPAPAVARGGNSILRTKHKIANSEWKATGE
jgi:hypothetical protein